MLILAEHAGSFWEEYIGLLTNPAHVAFELTLEAVTAILVYPFAKAIWKKIVIKHDQEHHPHDTH